MAIIYHIIIHYAIVIHSILYTEHIVDITGALRTLNTCRLYSREFNQSWLIINISVLIM